VDERCDTADRAFSVGVSALQDGSTFGSHAWIERPTMTAPSKLTRRMAVRTAAAVVVTAAAVIVAMGSASAHVSISPESAEQGSTAELTFRVPNEEARAVTTKLQLQIPTSAPIAQLLVRPVPGWTVSEHSVTLSKPLITDDGKFTTVVDQVTWSGGRIEPGQYQDFALSVDPLPDTGSSVAFKALQTYSNGDVVRWIDVSAPGQVEAEHPAPVLALTSATEKPTVDPTAMEMASASVAAADPSSSWPGVLAVIALLLALAAVGAVGVMWVRRPRQV
jgi:periplasmic copper chaperone A